MESRKKPVIRVVSVLMAFLLTVNVALPATAVMQDTPNATGITLTDSDGNAIAVDESWEKTFPYGTFAFENSQLSTAEGAGAQTIKVYRLGGTKGKAQIALSLTPAVSQLDDGTYSVANAAGIKDFDVEVEDTLPITDYQAYGYDDPPQAPDPAVTVSVVSDASTENTTDENGETVYGHTVLTADVSADSYQWQALGEAGWEDVQSTERTLDMDNQAREAGDFRCVYTIDSVKYCTTSLNGTAYVAEDNSAQEIPADLDRNPPQSFHKLDLADGEYDTYQFYMTFAEGEWVKEIHITPIDDSASENVELAALKIDSCKGGELHDTANTALISIEDNDAVLPSYFAFETGAITVDKAAGTASLKVKRTGALQYVTTVDYHTQDGTAKAGTDYTSASGTLYFASDVSEMTIEVPLINDGVAAEEADKSFTVVLDNAKGGGEETAVTQGTATVSLYNTAKAVDPNLATMLYTPEADDVTNSTETTQHAIAEPSDKTVSATPVDPGAAAKVDVSFGGGDVGALTYDASGLLNLSRGNLPASNYWDSYADLGGMSNYGATNNTQGLAYQGWDNYGQVGQDGAGFMGRYVEDITGGNNRYSRWNTQTFSVFDQQFSHVYGLYHASTHWNWAGTFYSTASAGIAPFGAGYPESWLRSSAGWVTNKPLDFNVEAGATGLYISLGIDSKGWADTGSPNGEVYQKARALRRYLTQPLRYRVHTADDNTITAAQKTALYSGIAPAVSVPAGKGGVASTNMVYIGTQLALGKPNASTYSYATQNVSNGSAVYLANSGGTVNTGSVAADGTAGLQIIVGGNNTFASNGARVGKTSLNLSDQYTVNVVLNRSQKIAIDVGPSVPRGENGRDIDESKIQGAIDDFWNTSHVTVSHAEADASGNGQFNAKTTDLSAGGFSTQNNTVLASSGTYNNIRSINFHLTAEDQILFNGVQYDGNADIPIPVSMFEMGTLAFTYYNKDYVSVESNMSMIVTRVEHYVDMNNNGQLDGALDDTNHFALDTVNGTKDVLVDTLTQEEYAIGNFTPLYDADGNTLQQFFKFYYNMTPRCLTVPSGASVTDRAQVLPAFVTSVTDASQKAALSAEMQGYRFITSGKYSKTSSVYNGLGEVTDTKTAGTWTGDNKLMYQAEANATETVDIPLGGDYNPVPATYIYQNGSGQTSSNDAPMSAADQASGGWSLSDITFQRKNWAPDYRGNLLYRFSDPEAVFVSDSLVGENLPVANIVTKAGENGATKDQYDVSRLNGYLGSFNPLDTMSMCIRPQEGRTTDIIQGWFSTGSLSALAVIQSGEYRVEVDSATPAGFKSIPDASGLRRTTGTDDGSEQAADTSASSNSMSEFNVDLGIELPSLSVGLTDYVTLITDGSEFGFSIGIPVFKAEKSKKAYTDSDEKYGTTKPAYGAWEKSGPVDENKGNLTKVKDAFANPSKLLKGDDWKAAKDAVDTALDSDKLVRSKSMEFSVAVNVTVMFKYSAPDHSYKFTSAMVFLQFGFQYKQTFRLTVCPIIYAYFVIGASLELAGGVINDRVIVEDETAAIDIKQVYGVGQGTGYETGKIVRTATNLSTNTQSGWQAQPDEAAEGKDVIAGSKGDAFTFISKSDAINLYFTGKVKVELKQQDSTWKNLGYIASDGCDPVFVMFDEKVDGVADNQEVRVTILDEDANIDQIMPISGVKNDTYFSGLSLTPSIFLEVGAGIGVEVMKVEIYFKASISCSMSFYTRENNAATKGAQLRDPSSSSVSVAGMSNRVTSQSDDNQEVKPFTFNSMTFRAGIGVRVVLLLFNFEMDAIQFGIDYSRSQNKSISGQSATNGFHDNGWKFAWYVLNGGDDIATYGLGGVDDSDGFPGIKITLPSNTYAAQQVYGPEEADMALDEISTMAFDPENLPSKEFQISGYSSSGDAFRLADKLSTGTDYKLLTVGGTNYVLYTISRKNPENDIDSNMLVLSKVKNTGETVGLVNPADEADETPYIVVDNDSSGDLDFAASVTGSTINASWVSYAAATAADGVTVSAPLPGSDVAHPSYTDGTTVYMDATNFKDSRFQPTVPANAVSEPTETLPEVTQPSGTEVTAQPDRKDYYLTAGEYGELTDDTEKAKYAPDADGQHYYAVAYADYAEAEQAYTDADSAYGQWDTYRKYVANKQAWEDYNAYIASDEAKAYAAFAAAYDAWYAYYNAEKVTATNTQEQLANAAKNTVVKRASYTVGDAAFTAPGTVSSSTGNYMFLPAVSDDGKLTFYARTNNFSAGEKTAATQKAKAYYEASHGDASTDAGGVSTGEGDPTAGFRYAYTTSMDDVYGKNTQFMFSYEKDGNPVVTGFTPDGWETAGMRLDHCSMTMLDDTTFYLAYTASQTASQVSGSDYGDRTVHKLFLQKGSVDPATGAVTLETAKMLRELVDINDMGLGDALTSGLSLLAGGDASTADGVYANNGTGAKQIEAFEDPYFGNIRFLRGKLGNLSGTEENFGESLQFTALGADTSLFMVFEMNGATYVVSQDSLGTITASGTGAIIPFFTASEDNRTRGNVAIGTDGDGNIAAVYTDTVKNTTNNALYVAKYDPDTTQFGKGRMLAMNYMQVYEDSVSNGWSEEDTEKAYYGKLGGYQNGGMSSFSFSNLAVALGMTATVGSGSVSASSGTGQEQSGDEVVALGGSGGVEPSAVQRSTLVILAQGTQTALEEKQYLDSGENSKVILPKYDADGGLMSSTGYYALSFGVGEKNVGEGKILFSESNFTPGSILRPVVEFKNTGDVPLRGSETEPITLQLWISGQPGGDGAVGAGEKLAEWKISDDVAVGQTVNTGLKNDFYTGALPENLTGRKFYFTVSETGTDESPNGVDDPITYNSLAAKGGYTKTIEASPELAVENLAFSTVGVEGDNVKLAVSMDVTNRGGADSNAPYLQFAYQSGRTMEDVQQGDTDYQQPIYSALDIRSGAFEISNQTLIAAFNDADDRESGILRLVGADGTDLKKGYSRTVTGTFLVSKDAYCEATATGSLNLKVTVFDSNTTIHSLSGTGVQTSSFDNEYNGTDNTDFREMEPQSFFSAPVKVSIPLSTTMRLSLPITTTNRSNPVISVSELNSQALETTEKHMGVLYYNMGTDGTGKNGFLVMSPSSEGSGIIRVSDMATNTWTDIAYTVTESGTGVNIFKDNDIFTWYNAAGQKLNPDTDTSGVWMFQQNIMGWGSAGISTVPYLGDLSRTSTQGASFTFSTLAEKIELYFDGTVTVSSDFPGFAAKSYTATGGEGAGSYATIDLGTNSDNGAHMVTVKTTSATAAFDRMVETFSKNQDILPDTDSEAPQLYFSRILPETASLNPADYATGEGFKLTVYLLDASGLTQPAFSGGTAGATAGNAVTGSETFRQFDIFVKQNGTFTVQAGDTAGNVTTRTVTVDWFNNPVTEADNPVPLDVSMLYRDADGQALAGIGDSDQLRRNQYAHAQIATDADAAVTVQYYSAHTVSTTTSYALEQTDGAYELVKTVTNYDSIGQQLGEPTVTRSAATADTPVPKASTLTSTKGEWMDVPANAAETNVYAVAQNAVYKVTAKSDGKGTSSTRLFLMNRLNTDLPSIEASYVKALQDTGDEIGFVVRKGMSSQAGIQSVAVNGYNVFTASGTAPNGVSDAFPIAYGGKYVFSAKDTANNEQVFTMNVTIPIRPQGDDAITVNPSWTQARDNGSVTVDSAKLLGGVYDAALTDAAAGQYGNAYQFALVADADKYAGDAADDAAFDAYADTLAWQDGAAFTGLVPGGYVLYVRDAADTPDASSVDDYFIRALTVADTAVAATVAARRNSAAGVRTITVDATGGGGEYEYFLMKRADANDTLDAAGIAAAVAANDALNWKSNDTSTYVFPENEYGWHQVAVRDKNNPDNLYTEMVRMRRPDSTPLVTDATGGSLTEAQQKQIIQQNQAEDVIVRNGSCIVMIPAGTLEEGDSVNDLIAAMPDTLADPQSANVVQYTDADGNTFLVPWSLVSDGLAVYIAGKPGKYTIVHAAGDFADTAAHWARDAIDFVTARGLFKGTEKGRFSPDLSMSRGMFVTVLGRLAGIDPAKYNAQSFTDVASGEWYAPYVEWATRSGILLGYGGNLFGPDDEITREQMAVILYGFAQAMDLDVGTTGDLSVFKDQGKVSDWAKTPLGWAIGNGLLNGKSADTLDPSGRATRAEVSAILKRFIQNVLLTYKQQEQDGTQA